MSRRKSAARPSYAESSGEEDVELPRSAKKSKYFSKDHSPSEASLPSDDDSGSRVSSNLLSEAESSDVSEASSVSSTPRKKSTVMPRKVNAESSQVKTAGSAQKAHVKSTPIKSDESDVEGEVFIPKLAALPIGDTPYSASTIHPNSVLFLQELRENNDRTWFQQRDLQYQACKSDFDAFVLHLARIITSHDDTIPELPVKDLTFRIYRDIRFSNDRTPYKTFLAAYFSRSGRKGPWAGYYISLEPGDKTLLACGLWQPPAQDLALIRESIDEDIDRWDAVLSDAAFIEFFRGRQGLLDTKDTLKTCPKGFPRDHENIDLLRLKSFTVSMTFKDEEVLDDNFAVILEAVIQQMVPLVTMLNDIIRPAESD